MNTYTALIAQERAKIALLQSKIVECQRRIAALESFVEADDLDALLAKTLGRENEFQGRAEPEDKASGSTGHPRGPDHYVEPRKRLQHEMLHLMRFIGGDGKTLSEIEQYSTDQGFNLSRGALRSFTSNYSTKFGFLSRPRPGYFQLTERGCNYLTNAGLDSPDQSETPLAGARGVS